MAELIPITITLADRNYRIRIDPADEEKVRATVKMLNQKILEFKVAFAGKDMQDYITMVLLWFVTEDRSTKDAGDSEMQWAGDRLETIIKALENAIVDK